MGRKLEGVKSLSGEKLERVRLNGKGEEQRHKDGREII